MANALTHSRSRMDASAQAKLAAASAVESFSNPSSNRVVSNASASGIPTRDDVASIPNVRSPSHTTTTSVPSPSARAHIVAIVSTVSSRSNVASDTTKTTTSASPSAPSPRAETVSCVTTTPLGNPSINPHVAVVVVLIEASSRAHRRASRTATRVARSASRADSTHVSSTDTDAGASRGNARRAAPAMHRASRAIVANASWSFHSSVVDRRVARPIRAHRAQFAPETSETRRDAAAPASPPRASLTRPSTRRDRARTSRTRRRRRPCVGVSCCLIKYPTRLGELKRGG